MAHIQKVYSFSSEIPVKEFTARLFDKFEKECKYTRIGIVKKTETELNFKGPFFRFAAEGFYYLNGISGGKLEIKPENEKFTLVRTLCYKEFFLIALVFTILPILFFLSPIYNLQIAQILITHRVLSLLAFIVIWGFFFLGNIIFTSVKFSNLVFSIKQSIINEYLESHTKTV